MSELTREYLQRRADEAKRRHHAAQQRLTAAVAAFLGDETPENRRRLEASLADVDAAWSSWSAATSALTTFGREARVEAVQ